jgi:3-O-methylgallate 3,4-dioxygenase
MAKVVFGVATSHSPNLSTPVDKWHLHAERDQNKKDQHFRGKYYTFEQLLELRRSEALDREISQEKWMEKYEQWEQRIVEVQEKLAEVNPDILVVIGDDQRELFLEDGMPTFSVFWGEKVLVVPREKLPPSLEPSRWANFGERLESYSCHPELGKHIVEKMMVEGFDVAQLTQQAQGRGIGHSYIFTRQRVMTKDMEIPMVPVMVNTYFPPNQPTVGRCYAFGQALRRAIESWDSDKRVAIVASGGLSHFVVDEELDRLVLKALANKDEALLAKVREEDLHEGTSEIRNWIVGAGAVEHLNMKLIDYIPAYRTEAGTGCGMAFAWWE